MKIAGFLLLALLSPAFALAAELVNINTADATLLDTLPGIGPTYAARIIEYRTAHGPFARVEDIQNVSGIGPSTYADIAPLITIGAASALATPVQTVATPTTPSVQSDSAPVSSKALSIRVEGDEDALIGVPIRFIARTNSNPAVQISWSFGDGSSATGVAVEKLYRYVGTYLIVATATDGSSVAHDDLVVTVKSAAVSVAVALGEGIVIVNDSSERLDLSSWRLLVDMSSFRIPEGMMLLPKASVLVPYSITRLPMSPDVALFYPDGTIAVRTAPVAQLLEPTASFNGVQKVEPIISTKANIQTHEEAVEAPTPAIELAAVGAAMSPVETSSPANASTTSLLRSPWTLGFLGVMVLAAGAFILL